MCIKTLNIFNKCKEIIAKICTAKISCTRILWNEIYNNHMNRAWYDQQRHDYHLLFKCANYITTVNFALLYICCRE